MSETKELLAELDGKVSNMLSKLKEVQTLSEQKTQEIERLKQELQLKDQSFELVKQENDELKKALPAEEQEELKFKIGEMVKEIDRCISLLKV